MKTEDFAKKAVEIVKGYVDTALEPLKKSIQDMQDSFVSSEMLNQAVMEFGKTIPVPKDGIDGKPGESVDKEEVRAMVKEIVTDALEIALQKFTPPKDGQDGLDALDIEILPNIVPEKTYSRGTYAYHKGGLWKTFEQTKGMKGWECIIEGMSDISIDYDGEKSIAIKIEKSSGEISEKSFNVPVMIYKGIWKQGTYSKGDTVTIGGSLYHCNKETTDARPATSEDWTLCAKRGQDGKDGVVKKYPETHKLHGVQ